MRYNQSIQLTMQAGEGNRDRGSCSVGVYWFWPGNWPPCYFV